MTTISLADYEAQMQALSNIVNALESGKLSLDVALKQYEEGIALVAKLREQLLLAEQKVSLLQKNKQGEQLSDFYQQDTRLDAYSLNQAFDEDDDDE